MGTHRGMTRWAGYGFWASLGFCALIATGCAPEPAEEAAHDAEPQAAESQGAESRGAESQGAESQAVTLPVDEALRATLGQEAQRSIDLSTTRVLIPKRASLLGDVKVIARPRFTALSLKGEGVDAGLTVSLQSGREVHHRGAVEISEEALSHQRKIGGRSAWILENEGIWSATFEADGVTYVLDVECASGPSDPRCQSDAEVLAIAESLVAVGGATARPSQTSKGVDR